MKAEGFIKNFARFLSRKVEGGDLKPLTRLPNGLSVTDLKEHTANVGALIANLNQNNAARGFTAPEQK